MTAPVDTAGPPADTAAAPAAPAPENATAPAAVDPGTAAPPAPAPETAPATPPETERTPAPATPEAAPAAEPAATPDADASTAGMAWLQGLSDEDFNGLDRVGRRVTDVAAREGESIRRRTETETTAQLNARDREWLSRNEYLRDFENLTTEAVKDDSDGGWVVKPDTAALGKLSDRMWGTLVGAAGDVVQRLARDKRAPDYVPNEERARELADAQAAFQRDPMATQQLFSVEMDAAIESRVEAARAGHVADERKKWDADLIAAGQTATLQTAETARNGAPAPTQGLTGPGAAVYSTQSSIEAAHVAGQLSSADFATMRNDGSFDALPYV